MNRWRLPARGFWSCVPADRRQSRLYLDSDQPNTIATLKRWWNGRGLAANIMVKMPVTKAGVKALEEATYRGVNVNVTVSFTVLQALQVAEAVERGLARREKEGLDNSAMHPVCTIMVGRAHRGLAAGGDEH